MAITKKRSWSSAEEDDSSESHDEDAGPLKKTASKHFNVKSTESLPIPRGGPVPVITKILHLGEKEEVLRILLDTGSTVPLLPRMFAQDKHIPVAEQPSIRPIQDYVGQEVEGAGQFYTAPLIQQHRHQSSRVLFQVAPVASDYDAILPRWWLAKQKCDLLASNGRIKFTSADCQNRCTKDDQTKFPMKPDETIQRTSAAEMEKELQAAIDQVPGLYAEFIPIMTTEASLELPHYSTYDHAIDFKDGTTPPWGPIYPLNETELEELRKWLKKMTGMGAVRESKSAYSSPMLFIPKGHGRGLRLCIDYRAINKITGPNRNPLPNMDELKETVRGAKYFYKINHKNGYHHLRIKKGDEWKTAFRCRYGLFEYTVMPFVLSNAPATFQRMINHISRDTLEQGMSAFMDDIIIWSETLEGLHETTMEVLGRLQDNRLCIAPDKCK